MEFGSNTIQSKKSDGNSSSIPQKTRAKIFRGPYKGARPRQGKWVAEIRIPKTKKRVWLGTHDTVEAAAQAYDDASLLLYGLDGPCNFPNNRRPMDSIQMIGTKTTDEFLRIVEESTSMGIGKEPDAKIPPKLSTSSHSIDKPFVPNQLHHDQLDAHLISPESIVTGTIYEMEKYMPELDNTFEDESYFPSFTSHDSFAFDEAFLKGSDDSIINFMAKIPTNNEFEY